MSSDTDNVKVECTEQPCKNQELTGARKWLAENLLLMFTLLGVISGVAIGTKIQSENHIHL